MGFPGGGGIFLLDKTCNINEAIKINPMLSSARTEAAAIGRTLVHVRQPITLPSIVGTLAGVENI